MATRKYFQKGLLASQKNDAMKLSRKRKRQHSPTSVSLVRTAEGLTRIVDTGFALHQMGVSKAASKGHANGNAPQFTSESGRKAVAKRWAKHPITRTGMRRGARLVRRKAIPRGPLREKYSLNPVRGVQYFPTLKVWLLTDENGTRPITERTALRRLGIIPKERETLVPVEIIREVKK